MVLTIHPNVFREGRMLSYLGRAPRPRASFAAPIARGATPHSGTAVFFDCKG